MSDYWSNRPSEPPVLSMDTFKAALAGMKKISNKPQVLIMHPEMFKKYEEMERFIGWFNHLLRTAHKTFNEQYPDRRWTKRTRQRRYVQWCSEKAKTAAKLGIAIP